MMKIVNKARYVLHYAFVALLALGSLSANANNAADAKTVSNSMPANELIEFNKQYNIAFNQFKRESSALSAMKNPYSILTKGIHWGKGKKKLNYEENLLFAKRDRFKKCQSIVLGFVPLASSFKRFTEDAGMTKDELLVSHAKPDKLDYPFSVKDSNNKNKAHLQLFYKKGWEHLGKGEEGVRDFFDTCLELPIEMYIRER